MGKPVTKSPVKKMPAANVKTIPPHELGPAKELAKEINQTVRNMGEVSHSIERLKAQLSDLSKSRTEKEEELANTIQAIGIKFSAKTIDLESGEIKEVMTSDEMKQIAEGLSNKK